MKLVTAEEMRRLETAAEASGTSLDTLMERAGLGVAQEVRDFWRGVVGQRLLVLIGPGNNGGDGMVAARHLRRWGAEVHLYLCQHREDENFRSALEQDIPWSLAEKDAGLALLDRLLSTAHGVIEALFGTGRLRPLTGRYAEVLARVKRVKEVRPNLCLFALDLPSGLDANSGAVDPATPKADVTITLGYPKRGLFAFPGRERVGQLRIVDIGLPADSDVPTELLTPSWLHSVLPARPRESHKGSFGRVLVIAGSINYVGAAYLACQGAARAGAGLVTLATGKSLQPILATKLSEVTHIPLPEVEPGVISLEAISSLRPWLPQYPVVLIGPGLGQHPETAHFLDSF
ncbi:MAG: NAD(P)H-hydrate epimerase, partial [Chloroflexota bacterium]